MSSLSRLLAAVGITLAAPSFVLNVAAHGGEFPGPDSVDRVDGLFSIMFMAGAAFVVAALLLATPAPLGRKGRYLLYVEAVMVALGGMWAALVVNDPNVIDSNNPIVLAGDASWPLHQVFMIVVGIAAVRGGAWPSPARYTLFGPAIGLAGLAFGAIVGIDYLAAIGIGSGWAIAGAGVLAAADDDPIDFGEETQARTTVAA